MPLFRGFARKTLRASMRSIRSCHEQDLDDILQESYLSFLDQVRKSVPILNQRDYFFEILRHRCYRYMHGLGSRELRDHSLNGTLCTTDTPESEAIESEEIALESAAVQQSISSFLSGPDWKRGMQNVGIKALTAREKEVLVLFLDGVSFKEIASRINVDVKTVHSHYSHICRKIEASHPVQVVKFGIREGLTTA